MNTPLLRRVSVLFATGLAMLASGGVNATVIDTLPYPGTPDWTDVVFSGTSMVLNPAGTSTTLTTTPYAGVWFGWGDPVNYSAYPTPAWSLGTDAEGNRLSVTASLASGATDWYTNIYDGNYQATMILAPCGSYLCSGLQDGVKLLLADATDPSMAAYQFVPLDTTQSHTYEFLLKDGQVSYWIDGTSYYSGAARAITLPNNLRVLSVGDGSGSTPTGTGSMTVTAVRLEAAVTAPEPGTLALLGLGLAGLGLTPKTKARHRSPRDDDELRCDRRSGIT